jgi:hypothetical protein
VEYASGEAPLSIILLEGSHSMVVEMPMGELVGILEGGCGNTAPSIKYSAHAITPAIAAETLEPWITFLIERLAEDEAEIKRLKKPHTRKVPAGCYLGQLHLRLPDTVAADDGEWYSPSECSETEIDIAASQGAITEQAQTTANKGSKPRCPPPGGDRRAIQIPLSYSSPSYSSGSKRRRRR